MLDSIIHWIYCLPIGQAVLLALLISGGLLTLHYQSAHKKWWKPFGVTLLIGWVLVVLAHTVLNRGVELRPWVKLEPFQTYIEVFNGGEIELLRSAFMNVLLFYPGGLLLLMMFPKWKIRFVLPGFILVSIGIEACQYLFQLGFVELDDVLHNTMGAMLGIAVIKLYQKLPRD